MPRNCSRATAAGVEIEVGKAKERRARYVGRETGQRGFDRLDAAVDLLQCLVGRDLVQAAVAPGVMPDGVARFRDPAHQRGMFLGRLADQENVACTHWAASAVSTFCVDAGEGPSSNVSTTS